MSTLHGGGIIRAELFFVSGGRTATWGRVRAVTARETQTSVLCYGNIQAAQQWGVLASHGRETRRDGKKTDKQRKSVECLEKWKWWWSSCWNCSMTRVHNSVRSLGTCTALICCAVKVVFAAICSATRCKDQTNMLPRGKVGHNDTMLMRVGTPKWKISSQYERFYVI